MCFGSTPDVEAAPPPAAPPPPPEESPDAPVLDKERDSDVSRRKTEGTSSLRIDLGIADPSGSGLNIPSS
jgi:hypothetical protein